ncbi:MAG: glycoside hydrolase family 57 protein [Hydrogenothermaceae bacterium]|nr:glycoside hydrolase family 57 protein [Hydrogenothermaceae bacterium]
MDKKLYLCFLWHMHQPYYKNPEDNRFEMPWVFLHAIKDYYDMPYLVEKFGIKATFNLVPSLVVQLKEYENPRSCKFLDIWLKPVEKLIDQEKSYLLRYLFASNYENMIKPLDRYYQLFMKKHRIDESHLPQLFDNQEFLDLEVLFILSWSGNYLRQNNSVVKNLLEKGRNFTQEDKENLLSELIKFIKKITKYYGKLEKKRAIEITTSPFYHPILPLLIDINSGKESSPDITIPPVRESMKDFAIKHITDAIDYHRENFLKNPKGVWSSEGSLSRETVKLFNDMGFVWTATDEEILFNSLGYKDLYAIYKIYDYEGVYIFFRDRYLSDSIGFRYFKISEDVAVKDFIERLRDIYNKVDKNPVVSVILDGENAWEHYKNNGLNFFEKLYSGIKSEKWIETITFSEVINKNTDILPLSNLKAGSWIFGNFKTWIGHPEKNTAWEYLDKAVSFYRKNPSEESERFLMIAQGSDWFWWYGDDHYTPFSDIFDNLFRLNLKWVYKSLKETYPSYLDKPIKKKSKNQIVKKPTYYIKPKINGEIDNYFEWLYAGEVDPNFDLGSMSLGSLKLKRVFYGFDKENIYILIDGLMEEGQILEIKLFSEKEIKLALPLKKGIFQVKCMEYNVEYGFNNVLEIKIPIECINRNKSVEFNIALLEDEKVIERVPVYSNFEIEIENFEYEWMV